MMVILLLAMTGMILIFLEFFLPGAVLAVLGTIALLISLGLFFIETSALWGILYLLLLLALVFASCRLALWCLKRSKEKAHFYHDKDQEGYTASTFDQNLIGKEATVSTELKPAGYVFVDGKLHQALSESGFISKGVNVQILGGKGSHLIVKTRK